MSEVLKLEGRRIRVKNEIQRLELSIRGDIKACREVLDPFVEDLSRIEADVAAEQAVELAGKVADLREKKEMLARIEKELNI